MGQQTSIYLRRKDEPLLEYHLDLKAEEEETKGKSREEVLKIYQERNEYYEKVRQSFGCLLFFLSTTPTRELNELPYTDEARPLTQEMLEGILDFYDDEIGKWKLSIREIEDKISHLEDRILKANVGLYDKINQEIEYYQKDLEETKEELEEKEFFRNKFAFVKAMMEDRDNAERYELIYTKD